MTQYVNFLNHCYFIKDEVVDKATGKQGNIVEMIPLDKAKILWDDGSFEWRKILNKKGYNIGAIEKVGKLIKYELED